MKRHKPHPEPWPPHRHPHPRPPVRQQVSLLVPFKADGKGRVELWEWLRKYWECELPDAEIVMGKDDSHRRVFSKTTAVNNAARRAHGDIFVILDADTYISGSVITECATRIRAATAKGHHLWFVPYRHIFRLTPLASIRVTASDPCNPLRFSSPPPLVDVESMEGSAHGHHYGAMIQIMPREAFELIGGWDERMVGWGGEDIAALRAVDTLYGKHKSTDNDVLHLWHPIHNEHWVQYWLVREWAHQHGSRMNDELSMRYDRATGDRVKMRALVDEGHAWYAKFRRRWFLIYPLWFLLLIVAVVIVVLVSVRGAT